MRLADLVPTAGRIGRAAWEIVSSPVHTAGEKQGHREAAHCTDGAEGSGGAQFAAAAAAALAAAARGAGTVGARSLGDN